MALAGFAWVRSKTAVELKEALTATQESIQIYHRLAIELPEAFGGYLITVLRTAADLLDQLGRSQEALAIRRQLNGDREDTSPT